MTRRASGIVLSLLAFLFLLRVLGQALVAFLDASFLPPMEAWMSGLLPYPYLLASQVLILALQAMICADFIRGRGYFVGDRSRGARYVQWFAVLYGAAMVLRYAVTMGLHPERRWFGGTIPIWFHFVLAAFLLTFSRYHTGRWWPWRGAAREAA